MIEWTTTHPVVASYLVGFVIATLTYPYRKRLGIDEPKIPAPVWFLMIASVWPFLLLLPFAWLVVKLKGGR